MQNAIANAVSGGVNPGIEVIVKELNVIVKQQKDIEVRPQDAPQSALTA